MSTDRDIMVFREVLQTTIFSLLFWFAFLPVQAGEALDEQLVQLVKQDLVSRWKVEASGLELELFRGSPDSIHYDPSNQILLKPRRVRKSGGQQVFLVRIIPRNNPELSFPIIVNVSYRQTILVAKRDIRRGEILSDGMLKCREGTVLSNRAIPCDLFPSLIGKQMLVHLKKGTEVNPRMLRFPPMISRGEEVNVVLQKGHLQITLLAIARSSGHKGDKINLTCVDNGKRLTGTITGKHSVIIE